MKERQQNLEQEIAYKYDIGAVTYDWHPESVEFLKQLCILGEAKIVLSSNWRTRKPGADRCLCIPTSIFPSKNLRKINLECLCKA